MQLADDVVADLKTFEGFRAIVYDDATDKPVFPGTTLKGHPSVGYGIALDTGGITEGEGLFLLTNRVLRAIAFADTFGWFSFLNELRQRAIVNMIYNLGPGGFMKFEKFITAINLANWTIAYEELMNSEAASQAPKRYKWLGSIILNGSLPDTETV